MISDLHQTRRSFVQRQAAYSLLEMLAVVTILGIFAALVIPRFSGSSDDADRNACFVHKGDIEIQSILWHRDHGAWPNADLSDIGVDAVFFPDGLPMCPIDGTPYTIDPLGHVVGHTH